MKKIAILLLTITLPLMSFAWDGPIDKIFRKYQKIEGAESFTVNSFMIWLADCFSDDEEIKILSDCIDRIRILDLESCRNAQGLMKDVETSIKGDDYKLLMLVHEPQQDIKFYARKESTIIKELIIVMEGRSDNMLLIIDGEINFKRLFELSESNIRFS